MLLATIISLLLTILIYLHLSVYNKRRKYAHIISPPLPSLLLYLLGHLPRISKMRKEHRDGASFEIYCSEPLRQELQTDNFVLFLTLKRCFIVINHLPKISAILSDHNSFKKSKEFQQRLSKLEGIRTLGPHGLLTEIGTHVWYTKRKILDPAFHKKYLKRTVDSMNLVANKAIDFIRSNNVEGEDINLFPLLGRTAMEVVSRSGFDIDQDMVNNTDSVLYQAVHTWTKCMGMTVPFRLSFMFTLNPSHREEKDRFKRAMGPTRDFLREHAKKRMESGDMKDDILSHIIKANSFSDQLTIEDIVDDFMTFFIAGMETTANSMSFVIFQVLKHPEVYKKVREEVDEVYAGKSDLTFEEIGQLVYLEQVIKETMRISPSVQATNRDCLVDTVVDGLLIPKDSMIRISQLSMHRDPRHWQDPFTFNPDNFAPNKKIKPFTYMPFMAGPRSCIGRHFAMLEMKIVLSKLVRHFDLIDSDVTKKELETTTDITCKPLHGVFLRMQERNID